MSQAKVATVNGDAHKVNLSNGHTANNHPVPGKFLEALQFLTSDDSLKDIQTSISKVVDLEHQVEALKKENSSLQTKHRETCRTLDETHADSLGEVKSQKNDLERQCEEVKKELLQEKKARKEEESAKKKANAKVDQVTKDLISQEKNFLGLESKKKELESRVKAANEQVERLQIEAKKKDAEKSALMEKLAGANAEIGSLGTKLESTIKELQVWEGYTNHLHSDSADVLSEKLSKIWKSSRGAVYSCFKEGLKRGVIQNDEAWIEFKRLAKLPSSIPIPQSESMTAKQMCMAAILSVLARSLSQHIFTPTYVLKENTRLRDVLFQEAIEEHKRESLLRGLLTSIFAKAQIQDEEDRIQTVVNQVSKVVQTIADDSAVNNFRAELGQIVRTAQKLWYRVQQNKNFFDSIIELNAIPEWQWQQQQQQQQLKISDKANSSSQNTSEENLERGENLLVLFPGVYCMLEDGYETVYTGIALSKSQTIAAAAEVEKIRLSNETPQRSELARSTHPKLRRSSTATGAGSTASNANGSQNIVKESFLG